MEGELRQRDQRVIFKRFRPLNIEDTRKFRSQYIRDNVGMMLRDSRLVLGRWTRFFGTLLNANSDKLRLDIIKGFPQVACHTRSRGRTDRK